MVAGLHCGEVQADLTESLDGRLSLGRAQRIEEHLSESAVRTRLHRARLRFLARWKENGLAG